MRSDDQDGGQISPRTITARNAAFIGSEGGRQKLLTPALLVELDTLDANIANMQERCSKLGVDLRPHAKAHKTLGIAKRQLAAGAVGICVATPGEVEVFADGGITDILLTSTFAPGTTLDRLVEAANRCRLTLVLDNVDTAAALGQAAETRGITIRVLIDLDMGRHRSGLSEAKDLSALARIVDQADWLCLVGLQAYAGHLSHRPDIAGRMAGAEEAAVRIRKALDVIEPFIHGEKPVVSGGSTGAFLQETALGLYTEFQCGSYALMDAEYDVVDPDGSAKPLFPTSLFAAVRVISSNHPGIATTDGGEKRFVAKHGTAPVIRRGGRPGATYKPTSDEHGTVTLADDEIMPVGSLLELQVPHCDPTVNLYDFIHVVRDDILLDIWPIDARGA
ncbi:alanine racemase [Agrobacterium salinitolerans]|uniref:Alanine racemase n=1 Tax=Agrobacterium salinitolerans TaxID=1183413 RepID=A0A9X3R1P4_9HYPH|nr:MULTISPECIES: alanine racemase [Agrobacterium]MCZ7854972.1 alanine racemase [Agrobacterium salinitolerans]MCZ7894781.1 alanine racemase [Agrobacterium salinitolerans]MCZ7940686.1 alanine racemase [Agrobacterium salinitolerans]TRA83165.1 DSD1 family PLP-dependent enzyme [Agrobacterium salinitolerans]